jgi:hypothetical protein
MAIDIQTENPIPFGKAAKLIPNRRGGQGIDPCTLWRWATRGIRGMKLETILIGGIRYTSAEALQRFFERTTAAANGETVAVRTSKQRAKAIEAAERELAAAGI